MIDDLPTEPAYDSPFRPKRVRFPTKPKTAPKATRGQGTAQGSAQGSARAQGST